MPETPGTRAVDDIESVRRRFQADFPPDTIARLTEFGSDRPPKFLVPVINDRLERGQPAELGPHILAAWALFSGGATESGAPLAVRDRRLAEFRTPASAGPGALLGHRDLFGDLAEHRAFIDSLSTAYASFLGSGVRHALAEAVARADVHDESDGAAPQP